MTPLLVKVPVACEVLGICRDEVYRLIAAGEIERVTTGKRGTRIVYASLVEYVERLRNAPAPVAQLRRVSA